MPVVIENDLTLKLGREAARLSAAQAFETAQRLIRLGTRRLVQEEMGLVDDESIAVERAKVVR